MEEFRAGSPAMNDEPKRKEACEFVLVSGHRAPATGAHGRFDRLAVCLAERGHRVYWLSPARFDAHRFTHIQNIKFLRCRTIGSSFYVFQLLFGAIFHMWELRSLRKTALAVVTFGETTLAASLVAAAAAAAPLSLGVRSDYRRRHLLLQRGGSPLSRAVLALKGSINLLLMRTAYRRAAQLVVQSSPDKARLVDEWGARTDSIVILPNDLPMSFAASAPPHWPDSALTSILYVGNASPIKGFDVLKTVLQALANGVHTLSRITLVGVVRADLGNIGEELRDVGIALDVIRSTDSVKDIMLKHSLLVVPSREDSFPNVLLEALALRMPAIGANVGGIAEILEDKACLFESGSAQNLQAAIEACFDEEHYAHIKNNVLRQRERFMFNWCARYEDHLAVLSKIDGSR